MRKRRVVGRVLPQYDDGIVRVGRCPACSRDSRILTKHEVNEVKDVWSCADIDDCGQVVALEATVSLPGSASTDAARKVTKDGD